MKFITMIAFVIMAMVSVNSQAAISNKLHTHECDYDFAKDGGAIGSIDLCKNQALPVGSRVLHVHYEVTQAFTSGGSATVALGDADTAARYLAATAFNNAAYAAGVTKVASIGIPLNVDSANKGKLSATIATAALTAGKMKVWATVYVPKQ